MIIMENCDQRGEAKIEIGGLDEGALREGRRVGGRRTAGAVSQFFLSFFSQTSG